MIVNYLKIAVRNILNNKWYSCLTIAGLAIGITCLTLLIIYIHFDFSFKRYHAGFGGINYLYEINYHSQIAGYKTGGLLFYIYIFSAIVLFILFIIYVNFMNIAMSHYANRVQEVGIRKILGAGRRQFIIQFFVQALLFNFIAMIMALVLVECTLPSFSSLAGRLIRYNMFEAPELTLIVIALTLISSLLSGSFSAFFLSFFQPNLLRGKSS